MHTRRKQLVPSPTIWYEDRWDPGPIWGLYRKERLVFPVTEFRFLGSTAGITQQRFGIKISLPDKLTEVQTVTASAWTWAYVVAMWSFGGNGLATGASQRWPVHRKAFKGRSCVLWRTALSLSGGPQLATTSGGWKRSTQVSSLATNAQWCVGNENFHEDFEVPFFTDHIRTLTEGFGSLLVRGCSQCGSLQRTCADWELTEFVRGLAQTRLMYNQNDSRGCKYNDGQVNRRSCA
jgi:hypothetical protein